MDNVADFLRRAAAHRIPIMLALDAFPQNAYYDGLVGPVDHAGIDGQNLCYLHAGLVRAKEAYLRRFVTALRDRVGAPLLTTVLAYQLDV